MLGDSVIFTSSNISRLLTGLGITLEISLISVAVSLVFGFVLGILMTSKNKLIYAVLKICLEIVRVMPIIVWLFLVYFGLSKTLGVHISAVNASIFVFSIWGVFEMMDLVRGAIVSIPKHQYQSAESLALTKVQIYIYVIIPLATRRLVPACINLLSRMIKTTSVAVLIGVVELVKVGQQIIEITTLKNDMAPLIVYGLIFFIYFLICYPISKLSKILEKRWN
ncbi:MAG: amino acid ABC transporter permease [Campylobacter sp.]|nr:amino acid ABC transporter permease [Campylobacter sp.]